MHLKTEVCFSKYELNNVILPNRFVQAKKKVTLTEFLGEWLGRSLTYNLGSIFAIFHNGRAYVGMHG